jgi:hypothetical protein
MEDWMIECIEECLGFKLYDWQKEYIFGRSCVIPTGRRVGFTTAYMIKLIISEGKPIRLDKPETISKICDYNHGPMYYTWFRNEFSDMYYKLSHTKIKRILRKVVFKKGVIV